MRYVSKPVPTRRPSRNVSARVLLVDSHPIVRVGLRALLPRDEFTIVAEARDGAEAVEAAERHQPEVVLIETALPDRPGSAVCAAILERAPDAAVVVLSASQDEESFRAAVEAGARAYVLKDAESLDLADVIRRVLEGESVFDQRVASALVTSGNASTSPEVPKLSEREVTVLRLAAEGLTNSAIGERLYLSRHTVKEYLSHAMRKLEATNRVEAVLRASRLGLIEKPPEGEASLDRTLREPDPTVGVYSKYHEGAARVQDPEIAVTPIKLRRLPRPPAS
jgi:two-component system response regulator DevR